MKNAPRLSKSPWSLAPGKRVSATYWKNRGGRSQVSKQNLKMDVTKVKLKPMKRLWAGLGVMCVLTGACPAFADYSSIDLEIESIQVQPPRPKAGIPLTLAAVIRNNGSQSAASFYIAVSVRKSEKLVRAIQQIPVLSTLPRMGSGKSVPVDIGNFPEGDYEVIVTVDPEKKVKETDEENNIRKASFHVSGAGYGY